MSKQPIKSNDFPLGYTQADEDRHQRVMRNLRIAGIVAKSLWVAAALFVVYMVATVPPAITYERVPNDTPLKIQEQKHEQR